MAEATSGSNALSMNIIVINSICFVISRMIHLFYAQRMDNFDILTCFGSSDKCQLLVLYIHQ